MRRRLFTLLELLCVVVIILILASFLFGAFSKARRAAKAVQCAAQQHDVFIALSLFARNKKGMMPVPYDSAYSVGDPLCAWGGKLIAAGYAGEKTFYCPATKSKSSTIDTGGNRLRLSYGLAGGDSGYMRHTVPVNSLKIAKPANTIIVADATYNDDWFLVTKSNFYLFDYWHGAFMVHSAKAAVTFHDGAVIIAPKSRLDQTEYWGDMGKPKYSYPIN